MQKFSAKKIIGIAILALQFVGFIRTSIFLTQIPPSEVFDQLIFGAFFSWPPIVYIIVPLISIWLLVKLFKTDSRKYLIAMIVLLILTSLIGFFIIMWPIAVISSVLGI